MSTVRVRFAPSPTGNLHIGSARTALFNWLYARNQGGKFILRIEDTDKERSKEEYLKEILKSMEWLGLDWDEGPFYQSKRQEIYFKHAEELLEKGLAYKEGEAIIFKTPNELIKIYDLVHNEIQVDNSLVKDIVLIKSDGTAAYNFACTIDDIDMKITHVIRGDDHISNTNKQIALYNALEVRPPKFAHIPLILSPDRSRMSKRFGAVSISEYRANGYLNEAMVNYLSLLGWSPGDNKEFMTIDEIIKKFSLKKINKTGAEFNEDKLRWINGEHIRNMELDKFMKTAKDFLKIELDEEWLTEFSKLYKSRVKTLIEFKKELDMFITDIPVYNEECFNKFLIGEGKISLLEDVRKAIEEIENFDPKTIEESLRCFIEKRSLKGGDLIHPLRVALTGKSVSAGIFEVITLLGKDKTLKRLDHLVEKYKK